MLTVYNGVDWMVEPELQFICIERLHHMLDHFTRLRVALYPINFIRRFDCTRRPFWPRVETEGDAKEFQLCNFITHELADSETTK